MIFDNAPKILAHRSVISDKNFVTPEYILHYNQTNVTLFNRFCPHRMYPLEKPGEFLENIICKFHGFEWNKNGIPINNNKKLYCGSADIGKSGLVLKNFKEPNHRWVEDLAEEKNLQYSHSMQGSSKGSWLWIMEIQADLLHIRSGKDVVHPWLSSVEVLEEVNMDSGDGWVIQTCSTGWWMCIYPFTFVEWSKGCLAINYTIPKDGGNEFEFDWITQFYYDPSVTEERKSIFEKMEDVFKEDVQAIESQKGPYFPLIKSQNRLEDHCVHFGQWVYKNRNH